MLKSFSSIKKIAFSIIAVLCSLIPNSAFADGYGITVSPMNERIILNPGETYEGSFDISNANVNTETFRYEAVPRAFYVDDNYDIYYDKNADLNQIVDWITIEDPTGILDVNTVKKIRYTIDVPKDAPAGGQYAAIMVQSVRMEESENAESAVNLTQTIGIAHIIYAEIAGTSIHSGEIESVELPSFLLDGDITGSALIKNTGNVHGVGKYTLQVFPVFSNEEIYTNEENPVELTILPGRSRYNDTRWENTPPVGIFNVIYTVEFEGVTQQVSKMVIKCPIWLLFIIIFVVMAIIIFIVMKVKGGKKAKRQ